MSFYSWLAGKDQDGYDYYSLMNNIPPSFSLRNFRFGNNKFQNEEELKIYIKNLLNKSFNEIIGDCISTEVIEQINQTFEKIPTEVITEYFNNEQEEGINGE